MNKQHTNQDKAYANGQKFRDYVAFWRKHGQDDVLHLAHLLGRTREELRQVRDRLNAHIAAGKRRNQQQKGT